MPQNISTLAAAESRSGLANAARWLSALLRGWRVRPARQLRLCETLALGERRFLAVVQFEQQRFLIGGTGSSVALLAQLPAREDTEPACRSGLSEDQS